MPCQGPEYRTEEQIEEITQEVLEYLKQHHGVFGPVDGFPTFGKMKECWERDVANLRFVLKELIFTDDCISF
jgi:hypothetical protein